MDIDALRQSTLAFVEAHRAWAPLVTGLLAFCESVAFLSLLVPATVILVGIGALIGGSDLPFWPIVIGAAVGAGLGDWISYEVGHYFKDGVKRLWPMSRHPEMTEKAEGFLRRWGAGAVAIGRFFGPARAVVPLVAGSFGVTRIPFQIANWGSAFVWAFVLLAPGAGLLGWFRG
ncbi:DedA family protein [Methylobacterium organophilum]|uniref:Inner membrane protein YabI n=1 Tax=Methylobacterium organophilum TaxID=410 RepID=A0ABQ4TB63_METOR|nr:DedA family protein [Methylobacterium organophilum]UMY15728.1 DedA family protein [Methylobacterium organophilum]GJE28244.1 Inner membrane protein YabI [Methylobacterium organophilum]